MTKLLVVEDDEKIAAAVKRGLAAEGFTVELSGDGDLPSLTCEADEVNQDHRQAGVQVNSVEISCAAGEVADLAMEWLAKSHDDSASLTSTPSYKNDPLTFVSATVTVGATPLTDVKAVNFKIDNALEQVHTLTTNNRDPAEVRRSGMPTFTGKLDFIDFPADEYARLQEAETFKLTLYFEGAAIGATAYKKSLTIVLYACQYTSGLEPDIKAEVITTEGEFEAFYSVSDAKIVKITAVNDVEVLTS